MRLKARQDFTYYLRGVEPVTFAEGEEFDADDQELAEVAKHEGWAAPIAVDANKPPKTTRRKAKE